MQLKTSRDAEGAKGWGAQHVCLPLDKFDIDGPNGTHYCFVYPVLGPRAWLGLYRGSEDPDLVLRNVCLQVVEAIAFLHSHGICHGGMVSHRPLYMLSKNGLYEAAESLTASKSDLTPKNILHSVSGLDGLSENTVIRILGAPSLNKVCNPDSGAESHNNPSAPQYQVYPIDWHAVDPGISAAIYASSTSASRLQHLSHRKSSNSWAVPFAGAHPRTDGRVRL